MRRRTAAVRALVSRDQWQAAARKWHTDYPARGEGAEPGLRRTPGERVNSEGFRGFKSPPLRQSYMDPARVQGSKCRRDAELGCSHISGLLVGHQMKPRALMDFRALRSLSVLRPRGPWLATEFGSAGPTGSPSASYNDPTQPWQEQCHISP